MKENVSHEINLFVFKCTSLLHRASFKNCKGVFCCTSDKYCRCL